MSSLLKKSRRKHVGPYEIGKIIGEGTFGKVHLGTNIFTQEKVAIKQIKYKNVKTEMERKHLEREKKVLALLNHPNIVKLHKVVDDEDRGCCYMILEFVSGGELFDYIVAHGRIKEKDARKFIRQMISALEYCHAHLVIHRDLKPENLLLDENLNIKITDFGLSNIMQPGQRFSTFCGSLHYACPEILRGEEYVGPGVDIWAMGVILYCLVVGSQPWDGASSDELIEQIFTEGLVIPEWVSEECADLIIKMLRVKEKDRITLTDMKLHPWVVMDYNSPPPCYLPDQNPVSEIDEEIMQQLVQVGFQDTPENRADILANRKTQLVVTYHLLLQNLPPEKKKSKRDSDRSAKRRSRRSIEITKEGGHQRKKSFSFVGGGSAIPEGGEAAAAAAAIANVQQRSESRSRPRAAAAADANGNGDSNGHGSASAAGVSAAAPASPILTTAASPSGSPRSGSFTITTAGDPASGVPPRKNVSPLRGTAAAPTSPLSKVSSGHSIRRSSSPVPVLDVTITAAAAAASPNQQPESTSPTEKSSPSRSKSPKRKKKPLMPKLKLDMIGSVKNDPKMPMSADHRKLPSLAGLSALPEDGESKFGGSSERKMSMDPSSPPSDTDPDSEWRVGSLPEGSLDKWIDKSQAKQVIPPKATSKRPVLTLEELKKEVGRTANKSPGAAKRRPSRAGGVASPRHVSLRKSIKDLFPEPDPSAADPYSPRDANPASTETSAMFGCSSTSSKPTKEIRERVTKVLTEQNVQFTMETPNMFACKTKDIAMHLEIVKISKFKNMRGIKLARVSGDIWTYKAAADAILNALNL